MTLVHDVFERLVPLDDLVRHRPRAGELHDLEERLRLVAVSMSHRCGVRGVRELERDGDW